MDLLKASPETVAMTLGALSYNEVISTRSAEGMRNPDHNYVVAYRVADGVYFVERCLKGEYTYGAVEEQDVDNLHWYLAEGIGLLDPVSAVNITGELPLMLPVDYAGPVNAIVLKSSEGHDHPQNQWYEWVMHNGKLARWMTAASAWGWLKEYGDGDPDYNHLVREGFLIRVPQLQGTLHKLQEAT
jgi:hypothetical protein